MQHALPKSAPVQGRLPFAPPDPLHGQSPVSCVFKLLVPKRLAEEVVAEMGSSFSKVSLVLEEGDCSVSVTTWNDGFLGMEDQVISLGGPTHETLRKAVLVIVERLEQAFIAEGKDGDVILRFLAPAKMSSLIIGRGGENMKGLFRATGVRVSVGSRSGGFSADQLVTLHGPLDGMLQAVSSMLSHMQEVSAQSWYTEWALRKTQERSSAALIADFGVTRSGTKNDYTGRPAEERGDGGVGKRFRTASWSARNGEIEVGSSARCGSESKTSGMFAGAPDRRTGSSLGSLQSGSVVQTSARTNIGLSDSAGVPQQERRTSGLEVLMSVLQMVPQYVASDPRGFSLRCAVPKPLVDRIIGADGKEMCSIERSTGTRIEFSSKPSAPELHSASITGPLFGSVAAFIRMMKTYAEVETLTTRQAPPPLDPGCSCDVGVSSNNAADQSSEELPTVVAQLQQQLHDGVQQHLQRLQQQLGGASSEMSSLSK